MKNRKWFVSLSVCLLLICLFPLSVSANSSWAWISETRPWDILPVVVVVTLVLETAVINYFAKIHSLPRVAGMVALGNIVSFAMPYIGTYLLVLTEQNYTFEETLEHMPVYIVGVAYLLTTLLVEVPIMYGTLVKYADNGKKLIFTVIGVNILTTGLTALAERVFCQGMW